MFAWLGASASTASAGVTAQLDGGAVNTDAETVHGRHPAASWRAAATDATTTGLLDWSTYVADTGYTLAKVSDLEAKGGVAKLDDTITLPAAATVQLLVYPQGTGARTLGVGIGSGCGGEGATTAAGFHPSSTVNEAIHQVIRDRPARRDLADPRDRRFRDR